MIWLLFTFLNVLKLNINWLIVDVVGLATSGANLVLYYNAAKASKAKVTAVNFLPSSFTENAIKYILWRLGRLCFRRIGTIAMQAANMNSNM